jgi:hypothetical protein
VVFRDPDEVRICGEHRQPESDGESGEQCIDRSDLQSASSASIPEIRRRNVVVAIRTEKGQGGESVDDRVACAGAVESLEELLKHQAGSEDQLFSSNCVSQARDFGREIGCVPPKREGPDARVDEGAHERDRSAL